jgi:hypothetical protein
MKIFDIFRHFFTRHRSLEALETKNQALKKSLEASIQAQQAPENHKTSEEFKETFQLGLAAGYTGRAIKAIESSLQRIESQMVTKDWFISTFEDKTPDLINLLRLHEEEEKKRFEILNNLLISLQKTAEKVPQPIKTELLSHIAKIEEQLPLTQKMEELLSVVKELGEISYQDLALKLGISVSGLRGLLTHTLRRTDKIERVIKNGKGWVRYKGD